VSASVDAGASRAGGEAGAGGAGGEAGAVARAAEPARAVVLDGNEAVASVAHRLSEVIAIYPITPASPMGELADAWSAAGRRNLWGAVPEVVQMQSEGGAAGAAHGATQGGALATSFTCSQGLLLMIPTMYKMAGELGPFVLHVAARSVATHALSIYGDHSDVMACRPTGFALLASSSAQEAHDLACVAHAASLASRVPFVHFFDGFRTSHEVTKVEPLGDGALAAMIDPAALRAHRERRLTPDRPVLRGTAQGPDTFFQAREAANPFYDACPGLVLAAMRRLAALTGRAYAPFDYDGHPAAERVVVAMGSAALTARATAEALAARGERVGVVTVRLYRPFSVEAFARALPPTARRVAVLDRTKEPGAPGEPLYLDVVAALERAEGRGLFAPGGRPRAVGGRYGLASKEFSPAMAAAVFEELGRERPRHGFTVGINDDLGRHSLEVAPAREVDDGASLRAVVYGLGSDGTVGSNKAALKVIGERTPLYVQGHFEYDSKKAGTLTVSHLRLGPRPILAPYRVTRADFVACHAPEFLERYDLFDVAAPGATVLLNVPGGPAGAWARLPAELQREVIDKGLRLYAVDASRVAREVGLGRHVGVLMQACFFALAPLWPAAEAAARAREAAELAYGAKDEDASRANLAAQRRALDELGPVDHPAEVTAPRGLRHPVPDDAPDFARRVTAALLEGLGDRLPVSAFPPDGTWPLGTARWEKRGLAAELPAWEPALCLECNKCALVCPHTAIRAKVCPPEALEAAPPGLASLPWTEGGGDGRRYVLQVAPDDCTGCGLCVAACPAYDKRDRARRALAMRPAEAERDRAREAFAFFEGIAPIERKRVRLNVKGSQLFEPRFEYPGACAGCGETPYVRLLTQLFGDRLVIANATGCSSIFGGSLPTTPYAVGADGRGPAWSNSLFEDNAEFGFGLRLSADARARRARDLLASLRAEVGEALADALASADQGDEAGLAAQRERVEALRAALTKVERPAARELEALADGLVAKSVWLVGGDGWAYDIGYGGLDHVLASGRKINALVLDTEVYSNTGGQQSKATPLGAAAKFASGGKRTPKKDLGLLAMTYGGVYVARVAFGANDAQTLRALLEAEAYPGPALVIAYSHCIAHGYDLHEGLAHQRLAVESGVWPLYRFDPRRRERGEPALKLDAPPPGRAVAELMACEGRFRQVKAIDPEAYERLVAEASREAAERLALYAALARPTP
jgi:pyruvate-ferredoxin/flavodoxin oxidoreductase